MIRQQTTRCPRLVLWLAAVILGLPLPARAEPPIRLVQGFDNPYPNAPEPPLADGGIPAPAQDAALAATDPSDPPVPAVAVRVRVPASAVPGKELTYRLAVDNVSRAAANHVILRVALPVDARLISARPEPTAREPELQWRLGTMAAGSRREVLLTVMPTAIGDLRCCARVQFEHGQCVRTRVANAPAAPAAPTPRPQPTVQAELRVRKDGPAQALRYDALTYRLEVTNASAVPATDVVLTDTLPKGLEFSDSTPSTTGANPLTWNLGTIAPGQTKRVQYQAFAKEVGSLINRAVVTAAGGVRQEASSTVVVGEAKLTAVMTGPQKRIVNRPATYQITVTNAGTMPLANVQVVNDIPAEIVFLSASDGGQLVENQVRWPLGTLAPGSRRIVTLIVRSRKAGDLINRATVTADRGLNAQAEARTTFEAVTGLTVEIDKGEDPLEVGKQATYTIRILNQGSAAATNVAVNVFAPDRMKVTAARGPTAATQDKNRVTFAPVANLAPAAEVVFTVFVQGLQAGDARVRVEITADQLTPGVPLKQEESTTIFGDMPRAP